MIINEKFSFDEKYIDTDCDTITYFFTAPKEMLKEFGYNYDKEDEDYIKSMCISLDFPKNNIVASAASVEYSPFDGLDYFCWNNFSLTQEEIEKLMNIAEKNENINEKDYDEYDK